MTLSDEYWLSEALKQAMLCKDKGVEVPVGAVVVSGGALVATGHNLCIATHDASAHAEIVALRQAGLVLNNYRLNTCEVFVTLEPCAMCAAALMHARVKRVVFGAFDPKTGAAGSVFNLFGITAINHHTQVKGGVLEKECSTLLKAFFQERRRAAKEA